MSNKTRKCTISFSFDKALGYSWSRGGRSNYEGVIGGGGYETLLHTLLDIDLLQVIEHDIGPGSVPPEIMEIAKDRSKREEMNRVPIPLSVIDGLRDLGYPIDETE
jgi:hypothetical protein